MSAAHIDPIDKVSRDEVRNNLTTSMVVEAGAGTGKTSLLIDRLVSLIPKLGIGSVSAITFTEKAAAELADRLRRDLGFPDVLIPSLHQTVEI